MTTIVALLLLVIALGQPGQPLPFSHKTHVGLGLECQVCHAMPEPAVAIALAFVEPAISLMADGRADHRTVSPSTCDFRDSSGDGMPSSSCSKYSRTMVLVWCIIPP